MCLKSSCFSQYDFKKADVVMFVMLTPFGIRFHNFAVSPSSRSRPYETVSHRILKQLDPAKVALCASWFCSLRSQFASALRQARLGRINVDRCDTGRFIVRLWCRRLNSRVAFDPRLHWRRSLCAVHLRQSLVLLHNETAGFTVDVTPANNCYLATRSDCHVVSFTELDVRSCG